MAKENQRKQRKKNKGASQAELLLDAPYQIIKILVKFSKKDQKKILDNVKNLLQN